MEMTTDRLIIRNLKIADLNAYFEIVNTDFVLRFNGMPKLTKEQILTMIKHHQYDNDKLAICKKDNLEFIGEIGIEPDTLRHRVNSIQIGYWLSENYARKGLMTEALAAVIKHLFDDRGYAVITSRVFAPNTASISLLKKLGFVEEGHLKQAIKAYKDVIYDDVLFALHKDVYQQTR